MPLFNISLIPVLLQGFSKTKFCENFVILGKNEDYYEMRFLSCFCSVKNLTPIQRRHIIFNHPRCTVCVCAYDVASLAKISSNNSCKNFRNSRLVRCSWIQFANMTSLNHRDYIYSKRIMLYVTMFIEYFIQIITSRRISKQNFI